MCSLIWLSHESGLWARVGVRTLFLKVVIIQDMKGWALVQKKKISDSLVSTYTTFSCIKFFKNVNFLCQSKDDKC